MFVDKIKTGLKNLDDIFEKNKESLVRFQLDNAGSSAVLKIYVNDVLEAFFTNSGKPKNVLSFRISKENKKKGFPLKVDSLEFNVGLAKVKFKPKEE